jgi:hypothetical protein
LFSHATVTLASSYDSDQATIQKKGAKTAKVTIGKKTYVTGVCFRDGADWSSVKDHYELSDAAVASIKAGGSISVASDGSVSTKKK